jgi:hypothetical protein
MSGGTKAAELRGQILSVERSPPVEQVLQAGLLPVLVQSLAREGVPQLQVEAAWALTNIASTEFTRVCAYPSTCLSHEGPAPLDRPP